MTVKSIADIKVGQTSQIKRTIVHENFKWSQIHILSFIFDEMLIPFKYVYKPMYIINTCMYFIKIQSNFSMNS